MFGLVLIALTMSALLNPMAAPPEPTPTGAACVSNVSLGPDAAKAGSTQCKEVGAVIDDESGDAVFAKKARPGIRYSVRYETQCSVDEVSVSHCIAVSEAPCPDGGPLIKRWITAIDGPNAGKVVSQRVYCTDEPELEVPSTAVDEITKVASVTPARFREFPIQASRLASQPLSFALRNGHAHIYAMSATQTFTAEILDQSVRIRAIPIAYVWNYGDGTTRTLNHPGAPAPDHTFYDETPTSHVYTETGDYQVRLSTRFRGEYSTEGGPWIPIPGVANVPSEPMLMSVWRTKKLLVDSNCIENPKGPACDSPFLDEKP